MVVNRISKMGARGGGGGRGGRGAGGFTGVTARMWASRIGTTGSYTVMGANGSRNFSGGKDYEVYVKGDKGGSTFSFKSAAEGNKFIKQIANNGFTVQTGYSTQFN